MIGMVYIIEGDDGIGKSTAINNVKLLIETQNRSDEFRFYREAGGTDFGEKCRSLILNDVCENNHPLTQLFLFLAARNELYKQIEKDIEDGKTVIVDRGILSSMTYQLPFIENINREILMEMLNMVYSYKYIQNIIYMTGDKKNTDSREDNDWMDKLSIDHESPKNHFIEYIKNNDFFTFQEMNVLNQSMTDVCKSLYEIVAK